MLKILIADDHAVVRGGLRQFLADATDCRIAGEASSGSEALALIGAEDWDLLLLDIGLPDMSGLEVLKRVKQEKPALPATCRKTAFPTKSLPPSGVPAAASAI